MPAPLHDLTASIKVGNLFDNRTVTHYAGTRPVGGAALFWRSPGRSIFFDLEARAF